MHLETAAPTVDEARLRSDGTEAVAYAPKIAADDPDFGSEATLRLLRTCVEALALMQAKVDDLDGQMRSRLDAGARDAETLRAELARMQGVLSSSTSRATEVDNRIGRLEVGLHGFATRHADEVEVARAEAANWRMRVETDAMGFEQLTSRLAVLESGLSEKVQQVTKKLADCEADNVRLQAETRVVEGASERLRSRLVTLDATIADQRARISCLQNKLATATYAIRFEHMSRTMEAAGEHDILDLASMTTDAMVSAA